MLLLTQLRTRVTAPKVLVRGAEVGPFPELFQRVLLLLQRVRLGVRPAVDDDPAGPHLRRLLAAARGFDGPLNRHAAPGDELLHLALVIGQVRIRDHLQIAQRAAVVHLDERKAPFGIAPRPDPALHDATRADGRGLAGVFDGDAIHVEPSVLSVVSGRVRGFILAFRRETEKLAWRTEHCSVPRMIDRLLRQPSLCP